MQQRFGPIVVRPRCYERNQHVAELDRIPLNQLLGDNNSLQLVRSLTDGQQRGVTIEAFDRKFF